MRAGAHGAIVAVRAVYTALDRKAGLVKYISGWRLTPLPGCAAHVRTADICALSANNITCLAGKRPLLPLTHWLTNGL